MNITRYIFFIQPSIEVLGHPLDPACLSITVKSSIPWTSGMESIPTQIYQVLNWLKKQNRVQNQLYKYGKVPIRITSITDLSHLIVPNQLYKYDTDTKSVIVQYYRRDFL